MKPLQKSVFCVEVKTNSNFALKVAERRNHSFSVNLMSHLFQTSVLFKRWQWGVKKQETLRVVTIAKICSTLASLWKFQYFWTPTYNSVEHLWWSFYYKNSKLLSISTKKLRRWCYKQTSAFLRLFKRFISLKYFTLKDSWNLLFL